MRKHLQIIMHKHLLKAGALFLCVFASPKEAIGLTIGGPITASTVTVNGSVTISSMTISTMTINTQLNITGIASISGLIVQTVFSSTTASNTTTSTSLTNIPGMSVTIALKDPDNYVRISLNGILQTENVDNTVYANVSIKRDSTDLGSGSLSAAHGYPSVVNTGITIIDSPGDVSPHNYYATFNTTESTQTATFTASPVGYLLAQEVAR